MDINTLTPTELAILRELVDGSLELLWRACEEDSEAYLQYQTLLKKLSSQ